MRIAIMSRWNATCGVSLHAELIGRRFVRLGHEVIVFAPTLESANRDWHHKPIEIRDEPWVYRVYEETEEYDYPYGGRIDFKTVLREDYDVFIVEGYQRFPIYEFKKIVNEVKRKAPLVLVVHVGYVRDLDPYMEINWDAIVVFDKRYANEMIALYGKNALEKTIIIPYPFAVIDGARPYRPDFAKDKVLFITYGRQPLFEYYDYLQALRRLSMKYDIVYWIIRSDTQLPFKDSWIIQWKKRPDIKTLYSYVMGSDIHLLPKSDTRAVVVSSTIAQILYSGTPTVVPNTRYFETIPVDENGFGPVVEYEIGNIIDLYKKLELLIEDRDIRRKVSMSARKFALSYSDRIIARKFISLFEELIAIREKIVGRVRIIERIRRALKKYVS